MKYHSSKIVRIPGQSSLLFSIFRLLNSLSRITLAILLALSALGGIARAGGIYVPNYSFETPPVPDSSPYAQPELDYWEETPPPAGFSTNEDGYEWFELVGEFYNDPNVPGYIVNATGNQGAYVFADPQVGIFQDYNSFSITQTGPTYAFNATFNPGHVYSLTTGIIADPLFGPSPGATLQMSLYYRDASNNMVTVAATTITNTTNVFVGNSALVDFTVQTPAVMATDAWAGQNIGILFLSTTDTNDEGGIWDMDNVRLVEGISVPNYSFETPPVPDSSPYAQPELDYWEETPPPAGFSTNEDGYEWFELVGEFYNDPNVPGYIVNATGNQGAYVFADPQVGIFQDYNSFSITQTGPTYAFNATFNPGHVYSLTTGIIADPLFGPSPGATLQMSLYYRDASNNMVTVAATTITNTTNVFVGNSALVDFTVQTPAVMATDAWAGQNIGILFLSTTDTNDEGGIWDTDNVRLVETVAPALSNPAQTGGQFNFTMLSEPGLAFNVLSSTNIVIPGTNWISLGTVTNVTGSTPFTDPATNLAQRFYRLQQL